VERLVFGRKVSTAGEVGWFGHGHPLGDGEPVSHCEEDGAWGVVSHYHGDSVGAVLHLLEEAAKVDPRACLDIRLREWGWGVWAPGSPVTEREGLIVLGPGVFGPGLTFGEAVCRYAVELAKRGVIGAKGMPP